MEVDESVNDGDGDLLFEFSVVGVVDFDLGDVTLASVGVPLRVSLRCIDFDLVGDLDPLDILVELDGVPENVTDIGILTEREYV